ncbi:bifunctional hydroxymethylpyrimidine kinase/phosphomethylpyrimidine kinase [Thauera linaloolentis]|uniref:hydroxymethylpyrimidine kinase n=1 Tax=Thauera linaloolentis (strain DSM 12138 / JCM 21573 / CCUG 41526 / CIP 105981 / IAM 15112 / NBRC 102519 / 47Lol) TaxID=1123367 RepID=N6Z7K4_THAL4|nr:bifunctional hydroxymethylpyrimidine kinase/phosphomethylpyrimidine kinase [Thauera linaloolentis]ENO90562.1 phosphomethylpyrimidine kinase [Thauera linaloolentis 47Lol = DSM 12138]MCM8566069.1 bifunctional hydroxymethylpyrimidine kinase/phosphomethylpyrimidine kinase [Thauera linaloolentis]
MNPSASSAAAAGSASSVPSRIPNVVSIAGIDPSGGAGVFADLKAFSALGAYGCGVVAALTAQNTRAVTGVHVPPIDFLRLQIDTLFADVQLHATKIGMLGSAEVTATVADRLAHWKAVNVVLDPVMVAKSGDSLLAKNAIAMMREALFPQAFMITPNLPEAGVLLEQRTPESLREMYRAAERLRELLPLSSERWVLLKGGHLPGNALTDLLFDGDRMVELPAPRIQTRNTHGTGCTLSSAIAALLPQTAGDFRAAEAAVRHARQWMLNAIAHADELAVGNGHGPVHHFHALWRPQAAPR